MLELLAMVRRKLPLLTESQVIDIWTRWKNGETLAGIARRYERFPTSIFDLLARHGGIEYPKRRRSPIALSLSEREEISRGLANGKSMRSIATCLNRSVSTISREIERNGGSLNYRAVEADSAAWNRAKRPKPCKLTSNGGLRRLVAKKLEEYWSPQQISGWLKREYPGKEQYWVSHETIYKSLFIQARGVFKKELLKHLRTKPRLRGPRGPQQGRRGQIPDLISIRERPASVEDRALPGHWEGDLIEGSHQSFIATLVERHSRYVCLVKVDNKTTKEVVNKLIKHAKTLPAHVYKSLTWDRGSELKQHRRFSLATDIDVYFCDPKSPWQRGSNENTNGLLRQFLPKRTNLSLHSQADLDKVADLLNRRPRKTLDFEAPVDRFMQCVASTP